MMSDDLLNVSSREKKAVSKKLNENQKREDKKERS